MNSSRKDREIRRKIRATPPYESRQAIKCRHDVDHFVKKYATGLGGLGDTTTFKPKFLSTPSTEKELLDKYYIPSHYYPRDILTELGSTPDGTWSKIKGTILGLGIGTLTGLAVEALVPDTATTPIKVLASPGAASVVTLLVYWASK